MSESEQAAKKEVIKHSAAIQIQSTVTLLQRKAWNVLLWHAYDELLTEEVHHIPVPELARLLEYNSHNQEYLKETLMVLQGYQMEWNLLDKDDCEEWGVATLLAIVIIKNGICTYGFAPIFRQKLHNPRIYTRIDLSLQNKFGSKYAQALWELCTDYLGSGREYYVSIIQEAQR
jgi:hypothetical protein